MKDLFWIIFAKVKVATGKFTCYKFLSVEVVLSVILLHRKGIVCASCYVIFMRMEIKVFESVLFVTYFLFPTFENYTCKV